MADSTDSPRRERVERNIYRRGTGVFEVGFRERGGQAEMADCHRRDQRGRALRDEVVARRNRGEQIPHRANLRFSDAAARWLDGPVSDLRPRTGECYRNSVERHLLPRLGSRRLDQIDPDDLADLVRALRREGLSESTSSISIGVTNRIYRFAARRLGWSGPNPVSLMLPSERPKPSQSKRRRIFEGAELEQTVAAATEPWRTLFTLAALTGARVSTWIHESAGQPA